MNGPRMFRRCLIVSLVGALIVGCSGSPEPDEQAVTTPAASQQSDGEADEPDEVSPAVILEEYGGLLAAAATTGGDALERTLRATADAPGGFEEECAPTWAHTLLTAASDEDAHLVVATDGTDLAVAGVDVPVAIQYRRAVHRTDAPCDGRLPQPDRTPAEPPAPPTEPSPSPAPAPAQPQPTQPPAPPAPSPAPPQPTEAELVAQYDQDVADLADEALIELFDVVVATQEHFGATGGGEVAEAVYEAVAEVLFFLAIGVAIEEPPASRADAHEALVDGLSTWADEIDVLLGCALSEGDDECEQQSKALRDAWQAGLQIVADETGATMPSGAGTGSVDFETDVLPFL